MSRVGKGTFQYLQYDLAQPERRRCTQSKELSLVLDGQFRRQSPDDFRRHSGAAEVTECFYHNARCGARTSQALWYGPLQLDGLTSDFPNARGALGEECDGGWNLGAQAERVRGASSRNLDMHSLAPGDRRSNCLGGRCERPQARAHFRIVVDPATDSADLSGTREPAESLVDSGTATEASQVSGGKDEPWAVPFDPSKDSGRGRSAGAG